MSAKRDRAWGRIKDVDRVHVMDDLRNRADNCQRAFVRGHGTGWRDLAEGFRAAIRVLERAAKRKPATARARGKR